MSKTQHGFLGKVSKGINKGIFEDEPADTTPGSLIIERLQSLAGSTSSVRIEKAAERMPEAATEFRPAGAPPVAPEAPPPAPDAPEKIAEAPSDIEQEEVMAGESPMSGNEIKPLGHMATILVVEDDIVTQRLLRRILEERGYEVVTAADGVDALMTLGKIKFDLILCDINMPNLDGFTLVEFLNKKDIFIPVIFLTTREDVEDEIRGLALGARDYIRKPINRDLLLLRIRKALDR